MQHTQNYQLSRWEKDDRIMMEDFNADNEKIDAALEHLMPVVGTYTGDGKKFDEGGQNIDLGFRPRFVLITAGWDRVNSNDLHFYAFAEGTLPYGPAILTDTGFQVRLNSVPAAGEGSFYTQINTAEKVYNYLAFR